MRLQKQRSGKVWLGAAGVVVVVVVLGVLWLYRGKTSEANAQTTEETRNTPDALAVRVMKATQGGIERRTVQPGTVQAFDFESLQAKVSGFLSMPINPRTGKEYDRGDEVKKGELVAVIDAPELLQDWEHSKAAHEQAKAQRDQMKAHVDTAQAELKVAEKTVDLRAQEIKRWKANVEYRTIQYNRVKRLVEQGSIEQKVADEAFEQLDSVQAAYEASILNVDAAKSDVIAKAAKVEQAKADLKASEANVRVAKSNEDRAKVFVNFTQIKSHYDGVITARHYHTGDYIKSADRGDFLPLFVIRAQDTMRVVVNVPDADARLCNEGDPAVLTIGTLKWAFPKFVRDLRLSGKDVKVSSEGEKSIEVGGLKITDKGDKGLQISGLMINRISKAQDESSRTMRVEVDVNNKKLGYLHFDGMYGEVTILLDSGPQQAVRVDSSAVRRSHDKNGHEKATVYVVRGDVAHQVPVQIGFDNGTEAEVISGALKQGDQVIVNLTSQVQEGTHVRSLVER